MGFEQGAIQSIKANAALRGKTKNSTDKQSVLSPVPEKGSTGYLESRQRQRKQLVGQYATYLIGLSIVTFLLFWYVLF